MIPKDATWPIDKVVEDEFGLNFEYHNVTTEDGYILSLHRIRSANASGPVVFL